MAVAKGSLKVLIGAAPGVGKTYAMLREGHRLVEQGRDVAIALLETHGRQATGEQAEGLERIALRTMEYKGMRLQEMDVRRVLERHPQVALVDELAHTNVPGSEHEKRWQDVQELVAAGIDVITTINVQHIESLNDVVRQITGSEQRETVPDVVLRNADQVELVDLPPQMLRERLSAGLVYPSDRVDAALSNYFRVGNLTALRELALLWLAGNVDEALRKYREEQDIHAKWETRERVVVSLSGGPEGEALLRRGARVAAHSGGGELIAVHVTSADGLRSGRVRQLDEQRALVEQLGGSFHQVVGEDIVESVIEFAQAVNATQIIVGVSSRSSLSRYLGRPSVSQNLVRHAGTIDVHMVTHDYVAKGWALPRTHGVLPWKRKLLGLLFAAVTLPILTMALMRSQDVYSLPRDILANQLLVVIVATIGGALPAVLTALASGFIIDFCFIEPLGTFHIYERFGLMSLALFVAIALIVSYVVDRAERRYATAQRARAESELLASISGSVLRSKDPLQALVDRMREAFGFSHIVITRQDAPSIISVAPGKALTALDVDRVGVQGATDDDTCMVFPLNDGKATLRAYGSDVEANEQRLLNTIVTQVDTVLEYNDLEQRASQIEPLTAADNIRRALLNALSHDLRRPLASATAAVSGLREDQGRLRPQDARELLDVAADGLQDLSTLVTDLLDVSRLREDALPISLVATDPESVIVAALDDVDLGPSLVSLDIDPVPLVCADPPLLRRAVANVLANAQRFTPHGERVGISVSSFRSTVEIRVVDHGPGVADERKDMIFMPFQRIGDTDNTAGLGLGLALSKGFVEGMGGVLRAEDTPGGGLTMVIALRIAAQGVAVGQPVNIPAHDAVEDTWDVGSLILPPMCGAQLRVQEGSDGESTDVETSSEGLADKRDSDGEPAEAGDMTTGGTRDEAFDR